jgi:hypothetical protein
MTASTIAREPAAHIGENVSMMAAVETVLSKNDLYGRSGQDEVHGPRSDRHRADAAERRQVRTST